MNPTDGAVPPGAWIAAAAGQGGVGSPVRVLSRTDVQRCLQGLDVVQIVADTLVEHDRGNCVLPDEAYLPWENSEGAYSRSIAMPAGIRASGHAHMYGMKVINSSVSNPAHGLERAGGIGLTFDPDTARVTTIVEVGLLSALRTAAVSAIGIRVIGFDSADSVTVVGCGMQGRTHLLLLLDRMSGVRRVELHDRDPALAADVAERVRRFRPGVDVSVHDDAEKAVRAGVVVIFATTSNEGYAEPDWFRQDALAVHVSLADLTDDAIVQAGARYVDDVDLVASNPRRPLGRLMEQGRVLRPGAAAQLPGSVRIDATLGGLLTGRERPAVTSDAFTVLNPFGMGVLDVALIDAMRRRAAREDVGVVLDLG